MHHLHPRISDEPVRIEVLRGSMVESRHRVRIAIVDSGGRVIAAAGDPDALIFPRSAIKPVQALPLVEAGAVEALSLDLSQVALACASHGGEAEHVRRIGQWLSDLGLDATCLECGAHLPMHEGSAAALLAAHQHATALHNNCSGKHAGFVALARHKNWAITGYRFEHHPVQQSVIGVEEQMGSLDLSRAPRGIDGCGIPVIAIPIGHLALMAARFADPSDLPPHRAEAVALIRRACAAHPYLVAGTGGFCTEAMQVLGERALVKTGAEGVYFAALPELGLGVTVKAEDGATRASTLVIAHVLRALGLLDDVARKALASRLQPSIRNRLDETVGTVRIGGEWVFEGDQSDGSE